MNDKSGHAKFLLWGLVASVGLLAFMGCAKMQKPPKIETESHIISEPQTESLGSLWDEDNGRAYMFEDRRAGRVGDIVVVQIVEQHRGSKKANTKQNREASYSASMSGGLFGLIRSWLLWLKCLMLRLPQKMILRGRVHESGRYVNWDHCCHSGRSVSQWRSSHRGKT